MKKFLCLMIMTILLFTMTSCGSYVVEGEENALAVYTCSSDNMCGLEKVVIFENKVRKSMGLGIRKTYNGESIF